MLSNIYFFLKETAFLKNNSIKFDDKHFLRLTLYFCLGGASLCGPCGGSNHNTGSTKMNHQLAMLWYYVKKEIVA